jgi:hypothetical protein
MRKEKNLLSHMPEPKRRAILGNIVSLAIGSYIPVAFMNTQLKFGEMQLSAIE